MTSTPQSRRDVLKGAVAMTAAASVGIASTPRRAAAQEGASQARARIDGVLRQAVDAKEVPGVVAMAATDKGLLYEGAFGARDLGKGPAMTLDTFFRIASMTKAVTCVAAMQLVEQGKLKLEDPVPNIDPAIGSPQVLDGFDAAGAPRLRPAKRPIVLRHLLTHTAGFSYEVWNANTVRYVKTSGMPSLSTLKVASLRIAAGLRSRRQVGIRRQHRLGRPHRGGEQRAADRRLFPRPDLRAPRHERHRVRRFGRTARAPGQRASAAGRWRARAAAAGDSVHSRILAGWRRALLNGPGLPRLLADAAAGGGSFNSARLLKPEAVTQMAQNYIGDIPAGIMKTQLPVRSNDVDFFPGAQIRWGLGYMLNMQPGPNGRSAGTVSRGGIFNTYYWLDPATRVTGLIMTQILPFADQRALKLYGQFERGVYDALKAA